MLCYSAIRQRSDLVRWSGLAAFYLCVRSCAPPSGLLWFAVEMYMLFMFGREVERFIGRRAYIVLYLLLLVSACRAFDDAGAFGPVRTLPVHRQSFISRIFVAFATIYPRVELLMRIHAKWVALYSSAIGTLQLLAVSSTGDDLVVLWTSIGVAFLFVELNGAGPELAWWNAVKARFASKPKYHVLPKPRARTGGSRSESEDVYTSIDPILDKISKFGIGSLTASERRQLDRERERLLKNSE